MPRFHGTLTLHFWTDGEDDSELEATADRIEGYARARAKQTAVNFDRDKTEWTVSQEDRPTKAELSCTV